MARNGLQTKRERLAKAKSETGLARRWVAQRADMGQARNNRCNVFIFAVPRFSLASGPL